MLFGFVRAVLGVLAVLGALAHPGRAWAQTGSAPTLLVLDPVGAPDATTASAVRDALVQVGQARGYVVVVAGAGSVVGTLDPVSSASLVGVVQRSGVHRGVVAWLVPMGAGWDVHVGLATADGTAASIHALASPTDLPGAASRGLSAILTGPFVPTTAAWGGVVGGSAPSGPVVTVAVPPPSAAAVTTPPSFSADAPAEQHHHDRPTGLLVAGASMLGGGWVAGFAIGLFGGYHDRSCIDLWGGGCSLPPGTSWDPAWDDFRASSLLPVVGPWIQLAVKPPSSDGWPIWLVADGILQGAGLVMLIVGIVVFDSARPPADDAVAVLPLVGPGEAGLAAAGRF